MILCEWIKYCRANHDVCRKSKEAPSLPTRILEVESSIRLRDSLGECEHYIALSHCWGNKKPLQARENTIQALRAGVELDDLPTVLKEAVLVTRALGLKYIWIGL